MKSVFYYEKDKKFVRINRTKARNLFYKGFPISFCSCKLRPGEPCNPQIVYSLNNYKNVSDVCYLFNKIISNYTFYNCDWERGYYISFYADEENI